MTPPMIAAPTIVYQSAVHALEKAKALPTIMIAKTKVPHLAPSTKPALIPATTRPAKPLTKTIAGRTTRLAQPAQTPTEQNTATKKVNSSSDRRLN
jgi:hypothetical protein